MTAPFSVSDTLTYDTVSVVIKPANASLTMLSINVTFIIPQFPEFAFTPLPGSIILSAEEPEARLYAEGI